MKLVHVGGYQVVQWALSRPSRIRSSPNTNSSVAAIENDELVQEAPAIAGCRTPSALAHKSLVAAL